MSPLQIAKTAFTRFTAADTLREGEDYVRQHYAYNFFISLVDAGWFLIGLSLASTTVILPLFLSKFTHNQWVLGLIPGLLDATLSLPQLLAVRLINPRARQLPLVLWAGLLPRLVFIPIAALMFFSAQLPALWVVAGTLGLIAIFGVTGGVSGLTWQELIARIIPVSRRGRFFGARMTLGGLLSVMGASAAAWLLAAYPFPLNFAACAAATFACFMLSWLVLLPTREAAPLVKPLAVPPTEAASPARHWRALLRADANLGRFIGAYSFITLGGMATGFYTVYTVGRFGLSDAEAGWLNTLWFGASTVSNVLWGWVTDRFGPKWVLVGGGLAQAAALGLFVIAPTLPLMAVAFAFASASVAAIVIGSLTMPMTMGEASERPLYIGLVNTLRAPALVGAPLLGGWLVSAMGYTPMFAFAIALSLIGIIALAARVHVPHHPPNPEPLLQFPHASDLS
jgi:MFS family permease